MFLWAFVRLVAMQHYLVLVLVRGAPLPLGDISMQSAGCVYICTIFDIFVHFAKKDLFNVFKLGCWCCVAMHSV